MHLTNTTQVSSWALISISVVPWHNSHITLRPSESWHEWKLKGEWRGSSQSVRDHSGRESPNSQASLQRSTGQTCHSALFLNFHTDKDKTDKVKLWHLKKCLEYWMLDASNASLLGNTSFHSSDLRLSAFCSPHSQSCCFPMIKAARLLI